MSSLALILAVLAIFLAVAMRSTPCAHAASGSCSVGDLETFTSAITVNEDGNDADTRIEGDTNVNLLYVDAGNDRVGIGTASPGTLFDVGGTASVNAFIATSGDFTEGNITNIGDVALDSITADGASVAVNDDVFWANSTGVVIGFTAQIAGPPGITELQMLGTGTEDSFMTVAAFTTTDPVSGGIQFIKSASATIPTNALVADGERLGALIWSGADGVNFTGEAANLKVEIDGTPGVNDLPGRMVFTTSPDGADTTTERMRISADGGVSFLELAGDPSTITNQAHIYVKNGTNGAEIFVRDEAGNVTEISPHDGDSWHFNSCNEYTGQCILVDMKAAMSALQLLTGGQFVTVTNNAPTLDWDTEQARLVGKRQQEIDAWDATPQDKKDGQRPEVMTVSGKPQWLIDRQAEIAQ